MLNRSTREDNPESQSDDAYSMVSPAEQLPGNKMSIGGCPFHGSTHEELRGIFVSGSPDSLLIICTRASRFSFAEVSLVLITQVGPVLKLCIWRTGDEEPVYPWWSFLELFVRCVWSQGGSRSQIYPPKEPHQGLVRGISTSPETIVARVFKYSIWNHFHQDVQIFHLKPLRPGPKYFINHFIWSHYGQDFQVFHLKPFRPGLFKYSIWNHFGQDFLSIPSETISARTF